MAHMISMEKNKSISHNIIDINDRTRSSSQNTIPPEHHRPLFLLDRETTNIESHQLIWLSTSDESISLESLRSIVDYTHLFKNISSCQTYIKRTDGSVTFLVYSHQFAESLIPQIHHLQKVYRIYVYVCAEDIQKTTTVTKNFLQQQQWTSIYKKVKLLYASVHQLLSDLSKDVQAYLQHQPKSLDNFWSKCKLDDHSTDYPESSWASLIDFWFYLPYPEDCRQRFVDTLKVYYNGVDAKIKVLEEFECNYNGKNAIQWYTRETFLYNILNRALRQHSIQLMFLFGFFLQDIHRQLQYEYKKMKLEWTESKLTLYRGQLISSTELQEQKNPLAPPLFSYMGTKIINNSLFSTTSNRSLALFYINRDLDSRDIYSNQSVLFEIEVNMREEDEDSCCRRPFANISHLSQFESEEEILFMIGTRFRYDQKSIQYNADEHVWIFKLEMDNNNFGIYENELGCLCKRRALKRCIMLLTRDNRERWTSTPPVRLKVIFRELCEMYPTEITWISAMKCHCLAVYQQFKEEKYTKALTYYYEALKLWYHYVTDEELICLSDLGDIHYQIACCFNFEIKDLKKAKTHYDQSIHFYELAISEKFALSNYERVQVYNELALVYERRNRLNEHKIANYLTQIKYRELYFENAFRYYSPKDTISVWPVLELIAGSYEYVGEIDKAISYYETALALREGLATLEDYSKITYPLHNIQHLIDIYRNLIKLYMNHKHNYNLALNYRSILYDYELQLDQGYGNNGTEREKRLLANKHSDLADIYRGLNQYQLAYDHLQIALNEYEAMEPSNSIDCDITMDYSQHKKIKKISIS